MNTKFLKTSRNLILTLVAGFQLTASAQANTNPLPKFDEVYKLLRENMVGVNAEELDHAAVRGLLRELSPQVSLGGAPVSTNASDTNLVAKSATYDKNYVYIRLGRVADGVAERMADEYKKQAGTNKIKGVVLDLRFAGGTDFQAAGKVADQFLNSEQPLIDWGAGNVASTKKTDPIAAPLAILVNRETRGASEALAAVLHELKVGLVIGSTTAGEASIFKEFPLENGQKLRIAVAPVKVGPAKPTALDGIKPDIEVPVLLSDERSYLEDPYRAATKPITAVKMSLDTNTVASAETNAPRTRLNEAELVRRHREGLSIDEEFVEKNRDGSEEIKLIADPVLSRALDLLKGLAVIGQSRPL